MRVSYFRDQNFCFKSTKYFERKEKKVRLTREKNTQIMLEITQTISKIISFQIKIQVIRKVLVE